VEFYSSRYYASSLKIPPANGRIKEERMAVSRAEEPDPMVLLLLSVALVVVSLGLFVAVPHSLETAVLVSLTFVASTALAILASAMMLDRQERQRSR
jgi:hypothetical protein